MKGELRLMKRMVLPLIIFAAACSEPPPTDRIRVSGHVEATETRLVTAPLAAVLATDWST